MKVERRATLATDANGLNRFIQGGFCLVTVGNVCCSIKLYIYMLCDDKRKGKKNEASSQQTEIN